MDNFFPFPIKKDRKKKEEPLPLYEEQFPIPPMEPKSEDEEQPRIIIIQL